MNNRKVITCTLIFLLCLGAGFLSGTLFKNNQHEAEAASSSIAVQDNNQIITEDQGTPTITRTSTVTVKDTNANYGYVLSAKVKNNSIPNSTVQISSATSTTCSESAPCTLPVDNGTGTTTPLAILSTFGTISNPNSATTTQGHTTDWTVTVTLPTNTHLGNYIIDLEYAEELYIPPCPVLQGSTYLQDIKNPTGSTYGNDTRVVLKDRRNSQDYYVQNIVNADGTCTSWMETNLRYAGDGNWNSSWGYPDDRYSTQTTNTTQTPNDNIRPLLMTSGTHFGGSSVANAYTVAGVADAGGSNTLDKNNPQSNTTFYGYLYNWCAAMGGQANACNNTETNQANINTSVSICPSGWKLPAETPSSDYYNLNQAINAGSTTSDSGLRSHWLGAYSGYYHYALVGHGSGGLYWVSAVLSDVLAHDIAFGPSSVIPNADGSHKYVGESVRCVKDTKLTLRDMTYLQDATVELCASTPLGATANLIDNRDGKTYRVRKMADSRCWMIDNLAYSLLQNDTGITPNTGAPTYSPSVQVLVSNTTMNVSNRAQYVKNNNIAGQGQIPNNGNPTPSYLYNWCAAMGDTSTNCATTVGYTEGQPAAPRVGICPGPADASGFRLPIGGAEPTIPGNGSNQSIAAATTASEFAKLDIWMGGTGTLRANANNYSNFIDTGSTQNSWSGVLSGDYYNGSLVAAGELAYWWSSNASSSTNGYHLHINNNLIYVRPASGIGKELGFSVRCIL